jgi:peptidase E
VDIKTVEIRLFSTTGTGSDATLVLDACRELLKGKTDGSVACLPQAMLTADRWLREAQRQFRELGRIEVIDTESMDPAEMEIILRRAALLYIPDGNAYLLNHRLHTSGITAHLRKKIQNGLPVVACGGAAVVCGLNVLTSADLNVVPTTHFDGLGITSFSIHVRYADDAERDDWLGEYHVFHDNPVLMLEDRASLRISGKTTSLRTGAGWIWRPGQDKSALKPGEPISLTGGKT